MSAAATGPGGTRLFSRGERVVAWLIVLTIIFSAVALLLWRFVFVAIEPGEAGVRYSLLGGGTVADEVLPEGYAMKLPWDRIYRYEVRIQQLPFRLKALSTEGMVIDIVGTVLYQPKYAALPLLQRDVGPDYRARLVGPVVVAAVRRAVANYDSHALYTLDFHSFEEEIRSQLDRHPAAEFVNYAQVLIRELTLPPKISLAIEDKLAQEQEAASYEYRILAQEQEANRQRIEAIGIRNFYAIVSQALTDSLLTWRGIEATVELSKSNNAKIVVVGGNREQMPLILGSEIAQSPPGRVPVAPLAAEDAPKLPDWSTLPSLFPRAARGLDARGIGRPATGPVTPALKPGPGTGPVPFGGLGEGPILGARDPLDSIDIPAPGLVE